MAEFQSVQSATRYRIPRGIISELEVLERGVVVNNAQGTVGKLDHVLVDRDTHKITHLVVNRGRLSGYVVLPVSVVEGISQDAVLIGVSKQELEGFPTHEPRPEDEILAEVEQLLSEASFGLSDIEVSVDEGTLKLSGVVADVATKRRAEAVCRQMEGVVDVEDALDTDTAIMARVIAALSLDPRTELSPIGVTSDRGVVTLRGRVDDLEIREAAEQIARELCDVGTLINELEVRPDEDSEYLAFLPSRIRQVTGE